jgi:hypothetical protein
MSQPRMISHTMVTRETRYQCNFEIDSEIHTISAVARDGTIVQIVRQGTHSHLSLSEEQWLHIQSEIKRILL